MSAGEDDLEGLEVPGQLALELEGGEGILPPMERIHICAPGAHELELEEEGGDDGET